MHYRQNFLRILQGAQQPSPYGRSRQCCYHCCVAVCTYYFHFPPVPYPPSLGFHDQEKPASSVLSSAPSRNPTWLRPSLNARLPPTSVTFRSRSEVIRSSPSSKRFRLKMQGTVVNRGRRYVARLAHQRRAALVRFRWPVKLVRRCTQPFTDRRSVPGLGSPTDAVF